MQTAHSLFEASRIPRDVEVDHNPGELQVEAFTRRIGGHHEAHTACVGTGQVARAPKLWRHKAEALQITLLLIHSAMDHGDFFAVAELREPLLQVNKRVS